MEKLYEYLKFNNFARSHEGLPVMTIQSIRKPSVLFSISLVALMLITTQNYAFSQSDDIQISNQTTLSGDLQNDPIAQDLLKKIEQTKQWIAELEQREYEKIQAKKFLDEKRALALQHLNADLKEWEKLWETYSSRNAFARFVDKKPAEVQGVFWDQFEFKEMKVKAGRDALKEVIANGGNLREAREAYLKAAETKRIELIEQNAQFNVKHNLAYYKQQILFNIEGQFIDTPEAQEKLQEYYTDYRSNPAYLTANPSDQFASSSLRTEADTACREGYVLIYRFQSADYTCVTESTAEMWIRHGMGEIPGLAEVILEEEKNLEALQKIENSIAQINNQITKYDSDYKSEQSELIKLYDAKYDNVDVDAKNAEKALLAYYNENKNMTQAELSEKILSIRDQIKEDKEKILDEKVDTLYELKVAFDTKIFEIINQYRDSLDIKIVWNSDTSGYQAVKK